MYSFSLFNSPRRNNVVNIFRFINTIYPFICLACHKSLSEVRNSHTKLDISEHVNFMYFQIISPVLKFLSESAHRVAFGMWYVVETSDECRGSELCSGQCTYQDILLVC